MFGNEKSGAPTLEPMEAPGRPDPRCKLRRLVFIRASAAGLVCQVHGSRGFDCRRSPNAESAPACPAGARLGWNLSGASTSGKCQAANGDEITLWTMTKGPNRARALTRQIPGVGVELRFVVERRHASHAGLPQRGRTSRSGECEARRADRGGVGRRAAELESVVWSLGSV